MRSILNVLELINEMTGQVVKWFIVVITGLVFAEVILRYVFNSPTNWGAELVTYIAGFFTMMAGGYIMLHDGHIRIDILYVKRPPYVRAIMDCISYSLGILFCSIVLWRGWGIAWGGMLRGECSPSAWGPPVWPYKFILPISCCLILLPAGVKLVATVKYVISHKRAKRL